jgi:hypothetical protein
MFSLKGENLTSLRSIFTSMAKQKTINRSKESLELNLISSNEHK